MDAVAVANISACKLMQSTAQLLHCSTSDIRRQAYTVTGVQCSSCWIGDGDGLRCGGAAVAEGQPCTCMCVVWARGRTDQRPSQACKYAISYTAMCSLACALHITHRDEYKALLGLKRTTEMALLGLKRTTEMASRHQMMPLGGCQMASFGNTQIISLEVFLAVSDLI
jgi:hypothetical protein